MTVNRLIREIACCACWLLLGLACAEEPQPQPKQPPFPPPFPTKLVMAGAPAPSPSPTTPGNAAPASPPAATCGTCTADYPCEQTAGSYVCRGQFAEGSPNFATSPFRVNSDGTVTDTRNRRTWQKDVPINASYSWDAAMRYCSTLSLAGSGWRLPTKSELESLIDFGTSNPSIDVRVFANTPSSPTLETLTFWTSSPAAGQPDKRWSVYFSYGVSEARAANASFVVRCVR